MKPLVRAILLQTFKVGKKSICLSQLWLFQPYSEINSTNLKQSGKLATAEFLLIHTQKSLKNEEVIAD